MSETFQRLLDGIDEQPPLGEAIYRLASEIYPITRSITGNGVRTTLARLAEHIPIELHEIATGTPVFDWSIPREWNINEAYIANSAGTRIIDAAVNNLHIVGYSTPVRTHMSLADLKPHLHSLPDQPDLIPYRTSYYNEDWGFCLPHTLLQSLPNDTYEVVIDTTLSDGFMTYGEFLKPGDTEQEIILTAHICHPSLANDNCSGVALLALLAKQIATKRTRYSYRFLFAPGTIGAIAWLSKNQSKVSHIKHGLVISNVGDSGGPIYKRSRQGVAEIDRACEAILAMSGNPTRQIRDFTPYGYDERQFCSPGLNLPVGSFQRGAWGEFPEYHTSADNLKFIEARHLETSARLIAGTLDLLEHKATYRNQKPFCEPQLGKYGLYEVLGTAAQKHAYRMGLLWVLNYSDGQNDLLKIAANSGIAFEAIAQAAKQLQRAGLIAAVEPTA